MAAVGRFFDPDFVDIVAMLLLQKNQRRFLATYFSMVIN
jgi:hypothetical protein